MSRATLRGAPATTPNMGALRRPVVDDRERELERVATLADGDHLVADLAQQPPRALAERLAAKRRERLRRIEALGGAADEQDSGNGYVIRHGSEYTVTRP